MATGVSGYLSQYYQYNAYYENKYGGMYIKPHYVEEYDVAGNYSRIKIDYIEFTSSMYSQSVSWNVIGKININGTVYQYSGTVKTANYTATKWPCSIVSDPIYHNTDGTKSINITLTYAYTSSSQVGAQWENSGQLCAASPTLTTIPRKSSLTAANGTLGVAQTLTIDRKSSNFAHSIRYTCGSVDAAIVTKTTDTSISFTPSLDLAKQNTTGTSVSITFTLYTFASTANDAVEIGRSTHTITCAIPASVKPSCALSITDVHGYADTFGGYVQGNSKLEIIVTPTLAYESPIASYSVSADGKTYGYSDVETTPLSSSGTLTVSATVKDQRGRSGSASQNITVLPYTPPAISYLAVSRCDSDGTNNDLGSYCKVTYSIAITSLSEKNAKTIVLKYKKTSESAYTLVSLPSVYSATKATYIFAAAEDSSYNVVLTLEDTFTTTPVTLATSVSTAEVPMHIGADGISIAFGKLCEKTGYEFGKEIFDRFGTTIANGLAKYESVGINPNETLDELILTNHANAPLGAGNFFYIHTAFYNTKSTSANRAQFAYPYKTTSSMFYRYYVSDAWSAWIEIAKASEVVARNELKTLLLDLVYPVNSIYISYSHTSPASLFGGTWYRVESRFLWGTTTSGTIGATAGEQTHTLTVNEMPAHSHRFIRPQWYYSDDLNSQNTILGYSGTTYKYNGYTESNGGNAAHNNMPPYVNVAIWRRTA